MKKLDKKILEQNLNNGINTLIVDVKLNKEKLEQLQQNGVLLFCGKTNNGMTTTLSTLLNNKSKKIKKIKLKND